MLQDTFKLTGDVVIERRKKNGEVIDRQELHNLIVNVGKERVAKLLGGIEDVLPFSHIAIGQGATGGASEPEATDTELDAEVTREAADVSYEAGHKCKFEKLFEFSTGDDYDISEAAVMDDSTAGVCLNRFVFAAKEVDHEIDLLVRVTITVN